MYTFIVNPNARSGRGQKAWDAMEASLQEQSVSYRVFFTSRRNHAAKITRALMEEPGEITLIVLGGDGTLNEVVNGITDLKKVILGYIPIGSGNDFARGMNLNRDDQKALSGILEAKSYTAVNVGRLRYKNKERAFIVSSGIGYDAGICHQVLVSRLKVILNRIHLGKLSYAAVGIERLMKLTPKPMTLTLDHGEPMRFPRAYFAAAFNTRYEGGGFKFCPDADPTDDALDIIVVAGISKLKALSLLPAALVGKHAGRKGIYLFRCRQAEIDSEVPLPVHTDGEPVFLQRHISFSLKKEKVRLILT